MKKTLLAATLALAALPSFAAVQYDFVQKNTTEDAVVPTTDLTARAVVDGDRSRVDFLSGNVYPPGTYLIAKDSARHLYFVDPSNKTYTEFNAAGAASALSATNLTISNLKSDVQKLADTQVIAGITADHYQLTITYDITLTLKTLPLTQSVRTVIDSWTTNQFGDIAASGITGNLHTGNAEVDKLLDVENSKVGGFPLRQQVTIHVTSNLPQMKSELKVPSTRTITHQTWVTAVKELPPDASLFAVPTTYRRADLPELPKAATGVLNFEPAGQ